MWFLISITARFLVRFFCNTSYLIINFWSRLENYQRGCLSLFFLELFVFLFLSTVMIFSFFITMFILILFIFSFLLFTFGQVGHDMYQQPNLSTLKETTKVRHTQHTDGVWIVDVFLYFSCRVVSPPSERGVWFSEAHRVVLLCSVACLSDLID